MRALNRLAYALAFVISAGEVAWFWGTARFFPLALDELLVAASLVWAAWRAPQDGARWHVFAWGAFCGLALVLLVETAGHQLHGPAKAAGPIYLTALSLMLAVGSWAALRALRLVGSGAGR